MKCERGPGSGEGGLGVQRSQDFNKQGRGKVVGVVEKLETLFPFTLFCKGQNRMQMVRYISAALPPTRTSKSSLTGHFTFKYISKYVKSYKATAHLRGKRTSTFKLYL